MDNLLARQVIALRKSVLKWEKIVSTLEDPTRLTVTDKGDEDCACCKEFLESDLENCKGCPVREKTGESLCWGSPYDSWRRALRGSRMYKDTDYTYFLDTSRRKVLTGLAKNELKFLQSLLKTKEEEVLKTIAQLEKLL